MPNKNYVNGRAFEYRIKKEYEAMGYLVFRTAGSHSPADLIAFPKMSDWFTGKGISAVPVLIQCKATKKVYLPGDLEQLKKIAVDYGSKAVLISKRNKKPNLVTWIVKE
jgi:Holliday junction resolvase